jgi:DNA-3-methyladenine glycosylase I
MPSTATPPRCPWSTTTADYIRYHDEEWGVPVHDDRLLFEHLVLDGAQAGLSWLTILRKRDAYRRAFANFDIATVARFGARDQRRLLADSGIVRNRQKISAAIANARAVLEIQAEHGSLDRFLWSFVDHRPLQNRWRHQKEVPAETEASRAMSTALRKHGMGFVGPTICYAFMQASGMVNDHLVDCHRYRPVARLR